MSKTKDLGSTFSYYLVLILNSTIWNTKQVTKILYSLFVNWRPLPKKKHFLFMQLKDYLIMAVIRRPEHAILQYNEYIMIIV
jgi:hypothetical protein